MSDTARAIEPVLRVTSDRAARFGTYPMAAIAFSTDLRRAGATVAFPLTTRDTVARDTPATLATSSRVTVPGNVSSAGARMLSKVHPVPARPAALVSDRTQQPSASFPQATVPVPGLVRRGEIGDAVQRGA